MKDARAYTKTHIRIDSRQSEGPRPAFYAEVTGILAALGFEVQRSSIPGACPECVRGAESLYCHPQDLSGYLADDTADEVFAALEGAQSFSVRRVDRYGAALNYTEEEYAQALAEMEEDLSAKILQRMRTKRRNLYLYRSALGGVTSGLPHFSTGVIGATAVEQIERRFIEDLFGRLVAAGKIVTAEKNGVALYRAATKGDVA